MIMRKTGIVAAGLVLAATAAVGLAQQGPASAPAPMATTVPVPARASIMAGGYLPRGAAPDSLVLLPPPPAPGSAAFARDREAAQAAVALQGSARWEQAAIDADLFAPNSTDVFSCAAGVKIGADTTPRLNALLRRMGPDLALAVYPTKRKYQRPRPFTVNHRPTCTPRDEAMLRTDGSYPSGHSAIGYGWGLVLAEIFPDRAAQLVARGRAFGDSRRVCNVHWLSDVEEGRVMATAVVARLHAEPNFRDDVAAARAEVRAPFVPLAVPDCARENAALAATGG
jgi:acid phosphatase (class A)